MCCTLICVKVLLNIKRANIIYFCLNERFFSWNINYKTELWRSRCQSHVTTGSPFWCPDPPGVHDQILVFMLNTDCRSVSDHPHGWACRSLCCRNMCQLFLFTYTQFFFFCVSLYLFFHFLKLCSHRVFQSYIIKNPSYFLIWDQFSCCSLLSALEYLMYDWHI